MTPQKRLFLLDAYALIFRGYYAFIKNPRINSKGMDTSAIMGFMNSLLDLIKREKPDHLAVAFDKDGSHVRSEMYSDYKSHRSATPEAILLAIPYIHRILEAMHIPIIELAGCEADDLIGTIAKQAEKQGYQVFMVTPDKDFAQLVSENIFMYKPARMGNGIEIWGIPEVLEKFGIERPEQVIDFLGMMGDAVDNIPGLPGVGEVTAKKLLKEFGSMENLLANTHQLKGKMKETIEANADKGIMSKKLATIICDCEVKFDETNYELTRPDSEKVEALFNELEFRRMAEQFNSLFYKKQEYSEIESQGLIPTKTIVKSDQFDLFSDDGQAPIGRGDLRMIDNTAHHYQSAGGEMAMKLLMQNLMKQTSVSIDIETTSPDALVAELIGLSFTWEKGKGYFVPVPPDREQALAIVEKFRPFYESETIEKVGHNLKYDLKVLAGYGIDVKGVLFDTMIAHYLINPDMRHTMDILSETYLHYALTPMEALVGKKGKSSLTLRDVAEDLVRDFAVEDTDVTWQLKETFAEKLNQTGTKKLFDEIEVPLVSVLADMELEGVRLDVDFLRSLSAELGSDISRLEEKIYESAGEKFNIGSPKQLGEILFDKLKIGGVKQKKTKTGQYATGEDVLSFLAQTSPFVQDILDWRQLVKLQNTYVEALPLQVCQRTGRVHTDYMQAVAATGRLSSNNPNLQNIPIRTERGRQIRKAFIPRDENHVLLSADYSQIELRIIAALSGEQAMIESFRNGEDIHRSTAAKVFNIPLEEVTREQRSNAKTVNFGIIYGVSAFGLSNQTSLSRGESKDLIEAYYNTYPRLREYISEQIQTAREIGYAQTISGRRRYLKDINSQNAVVRGAAERNAVNAPIQGSAADIIKIAMINIHKRLISENRKSKMLLQVHDELVFDVVKDELEDIKNIVRHEMENAFPLDVPLVVDMGVGENWLAAH
ncbi:MAG: DNA polymerase I [Flavobacterium sp.]|nr:MAG: DNA polymerase I [Flavobacterium sp.]